MRGSERRQKQTESADYNFVGETKCRNIDMINPAKQKSREKLKDPLAIEE